MAEEILKDLEKLRDRILTFENPCVYVVMLSIPNKPSVLGRVLSILGSYNLQLVITLAYVESVSASTGTAHLIYLDKTFDGTPVSEEDLRNILRNVAFETGAEVVNAYRVCREALY